MKAYKIDLSMYEGKVREIISEAVQRKAFELGYKWVSDGKKIKFQNSAWLAFWSDSEITQGGKDSKCSGHELTTVADFLELTTAKDEPTFKPFDKVLVRDAEGREWMPAFFNKKGNICYYTINNLAYTQCIPYEGNEHLLGTTEEAK